MMMFIYVSLSVLSTACVNGRGFDGRKQDPKNRKGCSYPRFLNELEPRFGASFRPGWCSSAPVSGFIASFRLRRHRHGHEKKESVERVLGECGARVPSFWQNHPGNPELGKCQKKQTSSQSGNACNNVVSLFASEQPLFHAKECYSVTHTDHCDIGEQSATTDILARHV